MKIYTIKTNRDLNRARETWLEAFEGHKGVRHPFIDFDWVSVYSKHFLKDKDIGITFCQNNSKLAVLPLSYRNRGYRDCSYLAGELSDYGDIITSFDNISWLKEALIYTGADSLRLFNVREDSPLFLNLSPPGLEGLTPYTAVVKDSVQAPYLDLKRQNWQEYLGALDKDFRRDISRQIKRLNSQGRLRFEHCRDIDELNRVLEIMYNQHIRRREDLGQNRSIFLNKKIKDFYDEVNQRLFLNSRLLLFYLGLDDEVIAIANCFLYDRNLYYYIPTFDLRFARYSPGSILLYYLIEDSFKRGLNELDFMIGEEDYKLRWKAKIRKTRNLFFFKNNIFGRIAFMNAQLNSLRAGFRTKLANSGLKGLKQGLFKVFYNLRRLR